jgi:hypothetical protein
MIAVLFASIEDESIMQWSFPSADRGSFMRMQFVLSAVITTFDETNVGFPITRGTSSALWEIVRGNPWVIVLIWFDSLYYYFYYYYYRNLLLLLFKLMLLILVYGRVIIEAYAIGTCLRILLIRCFNL